jgi:hypothetical protein
MKGEERSAFLKKSAQKTFAPAVVWTGVAINRLQRRRLMAIPVQTTAGAKVFLVTFFSKKVTSSCAFAFEKMDCFASLAMTGWVVVTSPQF